MFDAHVARLARIARLMSGNASSGVAGRARATRLFLG
jgi:hypothetical protein